MGLEAAGAASATWPDVVLSGGAAHLPALTLDRTFTRAELRAMVRSRAEVLAQSTGVATTLAVQLPPSAALVVELLAAWSARVRVLLMDHRLTENEAARAVARVGAGMLSRPADPPRGRLHGYHEVQPVLRPIDDRWNRDHGDGPDGGGSDGGVAPVDLPDDVVLVQLSSGSTGPSKIVGRTAGELIHELGRYATTPGMPGGERHRLVLLSSPTHTYGLIGGVLYGLHAGMEVTLPGRVTVEGVVQVLLDSPGPASVMGVPHHVQLLSAVTPDVALPRFQAVMTAGELLRAPVAEAFTRRHGFGVGEIYGMTEAGFIAADLTGSHRPAIGWPVPGMQVRVSDGELLVRLPRNPYLGQAAAGRWEDGWLHTRDAAAIDPSTGLITLFGRLDSQVSVGGMKVDLMEVEEALTGLSGVRAAVVVYDGGILAYSELDGAAGIAEIERSLAQRLAAYKLPRKIIAVSALPRTATGKLTRSMRLLAGLDTGATS